MKIIPPDAYSGRDREALLAFLGGCREAARKDNQFKVASISLAVRHIDPLAVLESIYEAGELHFYMEHPVSGIALAGAEAIVQYTGSGKDRFREAREFCQNVYENTIAVGDLDVPYSGPNFFCGFTFFGDVEKDADFPPATVFLPRWQVTANNGLYAATANCLVEADSNLDLLAEKIWAAHGKFSSFDYEARNGENGNGLHRQPEQEKTEKSVDLVEVAGEGCFEKAVASALGRIGEERYDKIVLARAVETDTGIPLKPLECLDRLRNAYPECYSFSLANGQGQSFIGATPERLLQVEENRFYTEALAGTAARGKTAREDARLSREFLESAKDRHEQQVVADSIVRRLRTLGIEPQVPSRPQLLKLSNVQHLRSKIVGELPEHLHLLDVVEELFPTPAVGGAPREAAIPDIHGLEGFDRNLYAGVLGWFNYRGSGEMVVGIRSALIDGNRARLYAGAGIVKGSIPEKEKRETDLKLMALLDTLR